MCGPSVPGAPTNATSGTNVVDLLCHRNEQSVVLEMLARTGMTIWLSGELQACPAAWPPAPPDSPAWCLPCLRQFALSSSLHW